MHLKTVVQSMRGPFLVLTPACVLLGIAAVDAQGLPVNPGLATLVLLGALMAHISVNSLNEYADLKSGLDLNTQRTPFSGGSGALPANPQAAPAVLALGIVSLLLTMLVGLYLIALHGWDLAPLGLVGLLIVVSYTPWINRSAWLCLVAPGLGFGFLMVAGTQFALSGHHSPLAWSAAAVPFFLVNNLLLLNQLPDISADREAGRRHLPIRYGAMAAARVYAIFAIAAYLCVILAWSLGLMPGWALLALLTAPAAAHAWRGARRHGEAIGAHPGHFAANVVVAVATPLLLAAGLWLGR